MFSGPFFLDLAIDGFNGRRRSEMDFNFQGFSLASSHEGYGLPKAPLRNPSSPWNHRGSIDPRLNLPEKIPIRSLADPCIFRGIWITPVNVPVPRDGIMLDSGRLEHRSRSIIPTAFEFIHTPLETIKIKMNQELHHMSGTPAGSHGGSKGLSTNPSTEPHCPIGQRIVGYSVDTSATNSHPRSCRAAGASRNWLAP